MESQLFIAQQPSPPLLPPIQPLSIPQVKFKAQHIILETIYVVVMQQLNLAKQGDPLTFEQFKSRLT